MRTAVELIKAVNAKLSGYPYGGECVNVHKNQWNEWIADCHIWGPYGKSPSDPNWKFYTEEDADCPIRQKMIVVDLNSHRFGLDYPSITMWDAKDDKRLPTFVEDGGALDDKAPLSPYIVEPIKQALSRRQHQIF